MVARQSSPLSHSGLASSQFVGFTVFSFPGLEAILAAKPNGTCQTPRVMKTNISSESAWKQIPQELTPLVKPLKVVHHSEEQSFCVLFKMQYLTCKKISCSILSFIVEIYLRLAWNTPHAVKNRQQINARQALWSENNDIIVQWHMTCNLNIKVSCYDSGNEHWKFHLYEWWIIDMEQLGFIISAGSEVQVNASWIQTFAEREIWDLYKHFVLQRRKQLFLATKAAKKGG